MLHSNRIGSSVVVGFAALVVMLAGELQAQGANNPYHATDGWENLPDGRIFGSMSGAFPDPDGRHLWVLNRCGGDICADSDLDPIMKFGMEGNLVASLGAGLFGFAHGFYLDHEGFLWVTEGTPDGDNRAEPGYKQGLGHQVHKLNQRGEVVMSLGEAGVFGDDEKHFNGPADVLVAPNGDIWVADGHRGGNNRIVKFSRDGHFLLQVGGGVGSESKEAGRFDDPHGLAMDSQGRLFVADRGNNRIQILDQNGNLLAIWTQFGKPSGVFIDGNDVLYVADGLSNGERPGWRSNYGWEKGIRIGDAKAGWVTAFIPNRSDEGAIEFLGVDLDGNIYVNDLSRERLAKFTRFRP
jgi:sugar lactone lactonase YvrE